MADEPTNLDNDHLADLLNGKWGNEPAESPTLVVDPAADQPGVEDGSGGSSEADGTPAPLDAPTTSTTDTEEEPESLPSTFKLDDDTSIDADTARRYLQFDAFLAENPDFVSALQGIADGTFQVVPVDQETQPTKTTPSTDSLSLPDDVDPDDPAVKFFLSQQAATQAQLTEALDKISSHESQITQQNAATTTSIINRATISFQKDHSLTNEQMEKIQTTAANLQILPALMSPVDPMSGMPRKVDPLAAVEQALETAYWQLPEFREQEIESRLKQQKDDTTRKGKLTALGGSSGSTPKMPNAPTNEQERRQAMIAEVAAHMNNQE